MINTRAQKAIAQYAKTNNLSHRVPEVYGTLEVILPFLGAQSQSRAMQYRIGCLLLQDTVEIIAPSCPDYSHNGQVYTFETVGEAVPFLTQVHCALLQNIVPLIPRATCHIVVADQEALDSAIQAKFNLSKEEFVEKLRQSTQAIRKHIANTAWKVSFMTERFPELLNLEAILHQEIANNGSLAQRITSDTIARSDMYRLLGITETNTMRQRTIATAAQYAALATLAAKDGLLVCNHETVNIA